MNEVERCSDCGHALSRHNSLGYCRNTNKTEGDCTCGTPTNKGESDMEMSAETAAALQEVVVYASGVLYCSACVPAGMPVETVETEVNRQNPTGIRSAWKVTDEPFSDGAPNPSSCADGPLKQHYLLSC